jgi:hypothetical protein
VRLCTSDSNSAPKGGHLTVSLAVPTAAALVEELRRSYEAGHPEPPPTLPDS